MSQGLPPAVLVMHRIIFIAPAVGTVEIYFLINGGGLTKLGDSECQGQDLGAVQLGPQTASLVPLKAGRSLASPLSSRIVSYPPRLVFVSRALSTRSD